MQAGGVLLLCFRGTLQISAFVSKNEFLAVEKGCSCRDPSLFDDWVLGGGQGQREICLFPQSLTPVNMELSDSHAVKAKHSSMGLSYDISACLRECS